MQLNKKHRIKLFCDFCPTRWLTRVAAAVSTVLELYEVVLASLESYTSDGAAD